MMGSSTSETERNSDEGPQHRVRITKPYYVGKYEVTQAQYLLVMGMTPGKFKGSDRPVEAVTWNDATEFCRRLVHQTGKTVRLPTEAEWEYACRAGSTTRFCFDESDGPLGDYAWYISNSGRKTHPVGGKRPNAWGLYDMHGNVWEWCADWYDEGYYANSPRENPSGPTNGDSRVLRGGGWYGNGNNCRTAYRHWNGPTNRNYNIGFRVVVSASRGF
jgi:formylglycine-generating enzyme required for sulfatase activity